MTCLAAVLLAGCVTIGDASKPIDGIFVPALKQQKDHPLVIVLPGFGNAAQDMKDQGIDKAVQAQWPEADVILTSATFAYYRQRNIVDRLQRDVIAPARARGYSQIWLAGASIGAMGVLFYEYAHPGEMAGLVLLAPWLGDKNMLDEIRRAGGIGAWTPGEMPLAVDDDNYQRELWRVAKGWSEHPDAARRVWLICGTEDRLLQTSRLLAPALPASHYVELPGSHNWETFLTATSRIISEIKRQETG